MVVVALGDQTIKAGEEEGTILNMKKKKKKKRLRAAAAAAMIV